MNAEQLSKLEDIRFRRKNVGLGGGQATLSVHYDVDTLLQIIDAQQAVIEAGQRELEISREARIVLEQIMFDGPVPDDGGLVYKRAVQLRKIEQAAREMRQYITWRSLGRMRDNDPAAKLAEWDAALDKLGKG